MARGTVTNKSLILLAATLGIACLVIAGLGFWDYLRTTTQGEAMPGTEILSTSVDTPSEKDPGDVSDEYKVPADQPRVIAIDKLGVDAYVQRVGIDKSRVMVAPDNLHFSGWYTGSVAPGEVGVSIISGHAGGRYTDGIFRHLTNVENGDTIRVQMGSGEWREFEVSSTATYSVEESARALLADTPDIKRELRLITCDGVFDDNTQTYDKRLIVTASLKDGS